MADAQDSGSCGVTPVGVQVPPFAFLFVWRINIFGLLRRRGVQSGVHFAPKKVDFAELARRTALRTKTRPTDEPCARRHPQPTESPHCPVSVAFTTATSGERPIEQRRWDFGEAHRSCAGCSGEDDRATGKEGRQARDDGLDRCTRQMQGPDVLARYEARGFVLAPWRRCGVDGRIEVTFAPALSPPTPVRDKPIYARWRGPDSMGSRA
jgi:hypothetical protein